MPLHHPPALANDRVLHKAAAQVGLTHERPRRDGNTRLVMLPLEFMQLLSNGSSVAARSTGATSAMGVRREKAALFQWVQAPPGNRSSRKQPEQLWR